MSPSDPQELPAAAPQIWSHVLLPYELFCIGAAFGAVSTLMAIEVWKKTFVLLTPHAP